MNAARLLLIIALAAVPIAALAQAPAPLATQPTNWSGVSADVLEFKRKGSTLTLRMRLHNDGAKDEYVILSYDKCYLLDAGAGKKYQVLKDDTGTAIGAVNSGNAEWRETVKPGQSQIVWVKFPAPPAAVKSVTLSIDNTPPFDDLAIQDVP